MSVRATVSSVAANTAFAAGLTNTVGKKSRAI